MKLKISIFNVFLVSIVFINFSNIAYGMLNSDKKIQEQTGQPFSKYWFPKELLDWTAENDKDFSFNKGSIPLVKRTFDTKDERKDVKIMSLAIVNKTTSSTQSQGKGSLEGYNFPYWQYIDTLVAWGGSSAEGLIVNPSGDIIDAAHKNGVRVLGTVFFPPLEYGGKYQWLEEFLVKKPDGTFPMADKLIEVAKAHGFDGWFINQETGDRKTPKTLYGEQMKEFLAYLQEKKIKDMEIIWYDSMIDDGRVFWQNQLNNYNQNFFSKDNKNVSDGIFLNFWWSEEKFSIVDPSNVENRLIYGVNGDELKKSGDLAKKLGRSPYDVYAGIDVQANGYNTETRWDYLFPKNSKANVSLALYCPSWTLESSSSFQEFWDKEKAFWVKGADSNPNWKGIKTYVAEKTPVTQIPFVTNFSMGNGKGYFVNGQKVSDKVWNYRSLMDVLPTKTEREYQIDYNDAFYGGNSLLFSGKEDNLPLFSSTLKLDKNSKISLTYKSNNEKLIVKFKLTINGKEILFDTDKKSTGTWTTVLADLGKFAGETLEVISLVFEKTDTAEGINLGEFAIYNENPKTEKIKNVKVEEFKIIDDFYGNFRLTWDKVSNVKQYEIYMKKDNKEVFLGATPNNSLYIKGLERELKDNAKTILKIKPINYINKIDEKNSSEILISWPKLEKPKASFTVSNVAIKPNDTVKLIDKSLGSTKVIYKIESPYETISLEGRDVEFLAKNSGVYTVTQIASNEAGETINIQKDILVVSNQASEGLINLALNKEVKASSQVNDNEAGKLAFDGKLNTKWCAFGEKGNHITVDLGKEVLVKEINLYNAKAGGEGASMNTSDYQIEFSLDKQNWDLVSQVKDNSLDISKSDINFKKAKYVKITVNKSEQGNGGATRIYEIEVLGLNTDKLLVLQNKELVIRLKEKLVLLKSKNDRNLDVVVSKIENMIKNPEVEKNEILMLLDEINKIK